MGMSSPGCHPARGRSSQICRQFLPHRDPHNHARSSAPATIATLVPNPVACAQCAITNTTRSRTEQKLPAAKQEVSDLYAQTGSERLRSFIAGSVRPCSAPTARWRSQKSASSPRSAEMVSRQVRMWDASTSCCFATSPLHWSGARSRCRLYTSRGQASRPTSELCVNVREPSCRSPRYTIASTNGVADQKG